MEKGQKLWLTKYALSDGIKEVTVSGTSSFDESAVFLEGFASYFSVKIGRDVHINRADAVAAADDMRKKKIASLERQIAKLKKREF